MTRGELLVRAMDVVEAAAELPIGQRAAFFAKRCTGSPELLAAVCELDTAPEGTSPILGDSFEALVPALFVPPDAEDPWIGRQLGPYLVQEKLGEGGMGLVYRAQHTGYGGPVALKVLHGAPGAEQHGFERLRHEAQMLARCKHPGIVQIFFGDILPSGDAYLTMELVEGSPINDLPAELPLESRLSIFVKVCHAVQAAHGVGVIHRDLKPSNILMTQDDSVKLLDFGLAEAWQEYSHSASGYMSFFYAAPEYLEEATLQTDIYSLGVILAELILGRPPFKLVDGSPSEQRRAVLAQSRIPLRKLRDVHEPPPKENGKVSRLRWAELEAICMKAMHPDPAARYATVKDLAEDVDRFLELRPISCLNYTSALEMLYHGWRFLLRHRFWVITATTMTLLLIFAAASYTWGLRQSRDAARQTAAHALRVQQFMEGLFMDNGSPLKSHSSVEALLDRGVQQVHALDGMPREQADILQSLGNAYDAEGAYAKAESLLQRALTLDEQIYGERSSQTIGVLRDIAAVRGDAGDTAGAISFVRRALAIAQESSPLRSVEVSSLQLLLEELWVNLGEYQKAVPLLQQVLRTGDSSPDGTAEQMAALQSLAIIENIYNHPARALELAQEDLALQRKMGPTSTLETGVLLVLSANAHNQLRECRNAEEDATQALSIFHEWLPPGHRMVAAAEVELADALSCQSRFSEATSLLRHALASYRTSMDRSGATAFALSVFGAHEQRQGHYQGAIRQYSESLHAYQQLYHTPNANWCRPLLGIARAELSLSQPTLAAQFATQAADLRVYGLEPGNPCLMQAEALIAHAKESRDSTAQESRNHVSEFRSLP